MTAPLPDNESRRLEALKNYQVLDTAGETVFDDIALAASAICQTPIALMTLVDENRQWFKARIGLEATETPREQAFCAHTILGTESMVVEDAALDERFADNPLVTSDPFIRFYVGAPLIDREGHALGSLCAIDREPRKISGQQKAALEALARNVIAHLELRRVSADLAEALGELKAARELLPVCAHCKGVRNDEGYWQKVEEYIKTDKRFYLSHSICPDCLKAHYPDYCEEVSDGK